MSKVIDLDFNEEVDSVKNAVAQCNCSFELVELFFKDTNIKYGFCRFYLDDKDLTRSMLESEFSLWKQRRVVDTKIHNSEHINAAFIKYNSEKYNELLEDTAKKVSYKQSHCDEWLKLQELSEFNDEDIVVLKTFIWNVKQALLNREQIQSPMPVLYSPLGRWGKSTFTRKLCGPISELAQQKDIESIKDSFGAELWSMLLVVDFDDLAQMSKRLLPKFKAWATQDKINMRHPRVAMFSTFNKITSPIASSNEPVSEIFKEPDGSRRLWQINLKKQLFDALDNVDFLELWLSVDENANAPICEDNFISRIENHQYEKQRYRDIVEIWFYDEFINTVVSNEVKYRSEELYKTFDRFRNTQNEPKITNKAFSARLIKMNVVDKRKDNKGAYFFIKT